MATSRDNMERKNNVKDASVSSATMTEFTGGTGLPSVKCFHLTHKKDDPAPESKFTPEPGHSFFSSPLLQARPYGTGWTPEFVVD